MPDITTITRALAIGVMALAAVICALYALTPQKRGAKRPLRGYNAIVFIFLMTIYIASSMGSKDPLLLNGLYTRIGAIILGLLVIGDVISDWRLR